MAVYRLVQIQFWQDGFVLDLTPEEKYFYLFLLTNSKTRQCGIYELPPRIMETETGYNRETVDKLITRFEQYGKIVYDRDTKEIILSNWLKHNKINGIKVKKCIEKELKDVKSAKLINIFLKECEKYGYNLDLELNNVKLEDETIENTEIKDNKGDNIKAQVIDFNVNKNININKINNTNNNTCNNIDNNSNNKNNNLDNYKNNNLDNKNNNLNNYKNNNLDNKNNNLNNYIYDNEENNLKNYVALFEQNIGLVNGIIGEWIIDISKEIDIHLFKKAIEIATDRGKCNKGYINGIINQWIDNNIKTIQNFRAYELKGKTKGDINYGMHKQKSKKYEFATESKGEDEHIYSKPSEQELTNARKLIEQI